MRRISSDILRSDKGSVAPTVGLSLFALIAAGGIAFDYGRLASMDTELQNAADQAALAAASQLDGTSTSMARAEAAARTFLTNTTYSSNDSGGMNVTISAVDVPSLTIRLDEAVRMVDELPLVSTPERATAAGRAAAASANASAVATHGAAAARASAASAASAPAVPAWVASVQHAWDAFSVPFFSELKQAVRVTSIEHPEAALMTP